jgi:transketolase
MNEDLRTKIVELIYNAKEGHIPSSLSIIDIINHIYTKVLKLDKKNKNKNDYFILSKGHGCVALYVVLNKMKIISDYVLSKYSTNGSLLGGHPDSTKIPEIVASTGSLGHGFPMAVGIALGLKIKKDNNKKVFVLLGDGECQEGTIWESANIAANRNLNNLFAIVDWNQSAAQLMPIDNLEKKWLAFGWDVKIINGHSKIDFEKYLNNKSLNNLHRPKVFLAKTIKGKGIPFMEGHGIWHHKMPNEEQFMQIMEILKKSEIQ